MFPGSVHEAMNLLREFGAPGRLLRHVELVGEATDELLSGLHSEGIEVNEQLVRVGVVLHDVGKTVNPEELYGPGSRHEAEGQRLMVARGVTESLDHME